MWTATSLDIALGIYFQAILNVFVIAQTFFKHDFLVQRAAKTASELSPFVALLVCLDVL